MGSGGWYDAWSAAPVRPRPAPPWQPDEAAVRRRVRQETAVCLAVPLAWAGLLVGRHGSDGGLTEDEFVGPVIWWSVVAVRLALLHVPGWRDGARRRLRDDVRVLRALRTHTDVGEAHRSAVSERARLRRWGIPVLVIGYPLVAGRLATALLPGDGGDVALVAALAAVYGAGLLVWPRQWREARRWLADPLPRGEDR